MKKSVYWLLAVLITLVLSIYQRMTGPTYPKRVIVEVCDCDYIVKLPRSGVQKDEIVTLKDVPNPHPSLPHFSFSTPQLHYRQYPTTNDYTTVDSSGLTMSGRPRCLCSLWQGNCSIISP